jgi:DMSO reductase anchor subunit
MEHYTSLMLFTFTGQTATGMIIVREILIQAGTLRRTGEAAIRSQYLITLLLFIALITAFFHLGRPLRSVYALNNLRFSPLSMEIASLSVLIGLAALGSWFSFRGNKPSLNRLVAVPSVIAALLLLVTMTAVYMLPSVPAWYNSTTPMAFVLTSISAGTALIALIVAREQHVVSGKLLVLSGVAALLLSALYIKDGLTGGTMFSGLYIIQVIAALIAFVLNFNGLFPSKLNKRYQMTVISVVLLLIAGIIARLLFFLSYDNIVL